MTGDFSCRLEELVEKARALRDQMDAERLRMPYALERIRASRGLPPMINGEPFGNLQRTPQRGR